MASQDDIMLCLGRLEGKQDAILLNLKDVTKRLNHHSDRLRGLETGSAKRSGAAVILGAVAGFLASWFPGS